MVINWLRGLQNAEGARFIIMTGSESPEVERRALASGAVGFFHKPVDFDALLSLFDRELKKDQCSLDASFPG